MLETLQPPVVDAAQAQNTEQASQQAAAQAAEQQPEPAFTVVDKRSNAPEPYFSETAPAADTAEVNAAQGATNSRVQELIDKQSFKLGSRAVERGKLDDMLYQDAIAQAAREGHDVTHLFEAESEGKHSASDEVITTEAKNPVETERIGKHSADNPDVLPISLDNIKAKLAQEAADKLTPFNPDGTPATMSLKESKDLSDDQKTELKAQGQAIGDRLTSDQTAAAEKAAEADKQPSRRQRAAAKVRSLLRSNKVVEAPVEVPVAESNDASVVPVEAGLGIITDDPEDDTEVIGDTDKADMAAQDQHEAAVRLAESGVATVEPFNPDGTPAKLSMREAALLTPAQREELQKYTRDKFGGTPTEAAPEPAEAAETPKAA